MLHPCPSNTTHAFIPTDGKGKRRRRRRSRSKKGEVCFYLHSFKIYCYLGELMVMEPNIRIRRLKRNAKFRRMPILVFGQEVSEVENENSEMSYTFGEWNVVVCACFGNTSQAAIFRFSTQCLALL